MPVKIPFRGLSKKDKQANPTPAEADDPRRPLLRVELAPRTSYGSAVNHSELRGNSWLGSVAEEPGETPSNEDAEWEEDVEAQGFYVGSYTHYRNLYSLVPLTSLVAWALLILLPFAYFPSPTPTTSYYPLSPELAAFILGISLWSLAHLMREPLYLLFIAVSTSSTTASLCSAGSHAIIKNVLRMTGLLIVLPLTGPLEHPPHFHTRACAVAWALAGGATAAELCASIIQGYHQLALYEDILIPPPVLPFIVETGQVTESPLETRTRRRSSSSEADALDSPPHVMSSLAALSRQSTAQEIEHDLDQLLVFQERAEVEAVYGVPIIHIPVFISCLQRIVSILLTLGFSLILAGSYLRSSASLPPISISTHSDNALRPPRTNRPIALAFLGISVVHALLTMLHAPPILPRVSLPVAAYVSFLIGLGGLFAGLGVWRVLT